MIIQCPTCAAAIEVPDETVGLKATLTCPSCGRVVVARDARVAPPAVGEVTLPFDPSPPRQDEQTLVAGRGPSLALPRRGRVSVAFLSGPHGGKVVVLTRPRVVLGRTGGGADIEVPDDPEVSRRHAAIECYGDMVMLRDEGSRNGTFVADRAIEAARLEDQTEFRLGATRFLLIVTAE